MTPNDLGEVLEEILDISAQWYQLGLQLKLKTGTLDSIQTQFSDPKRQLLEMLKTWLTTSENTSWKALTDALRSRSVGASQLAGVLEAKYAPVKETKVNIGNFVTATLTQASSCISIISSDSHVHFRKCNVAMNIHILTDLFQHGKNHKEVGQLQ